MAIQITFHISVKKMPNMYIYIYIYKLTTETKNDLPPFITTKASPPSLMFESFTSSTNNKFLQ